MQILTAAWLKGIQEAVRYASHDAVLLLKALERVQGAIQKELRKDSTGKFNVTAEAQYRLSQALRDTGWEVKQ